MSGFAPDRNQSSTPPAAREDWPVPAEHSLELDARLAGLPPRRELSFLFRKTIHRGTELPDGLGQALLERLPRAERILELCHLHPQTGGAPYQNPFVPGQTVTESFANIGIHSLKVAWITDVVTAAMVANSALSRAEAEDIVELAALHDAAKMLEILRRQAARAGLGPQPAGGESLEQDCRLLIKHFGLAAQEAALVCEASLCAGQVEDLLMIDAAGSLGVTADARRLLVHLADDLVWSSKHPIPGRTGRDFLVTPADKAVLLGLRYGAEYWEQGLAVKPAQDGWCYTRVRLNRAEPPAVLIGSLPQVHVAISQAGARLVQRAVDPTWSYTPARLVLSLVKEQLNVR